MPWPKSPWGFPRSSSNICAPDICQRQKLNSCPPTPACDWEVHVCSSASEHRRGSSKARRCQEGSETAPGADNQGPWRSGLSCHTERLGLKQTHPFVALQSLGFHPVDEISKEIAAVLSFAKATCSAGLEASLGVLFLRLSKWNRLQAAAVRLALLLRSLLVFISWALNSSCDNFPLGLGCFSAWTSLWLHPC